MEVYLDGVWKENGDKMVRLHDPAGQSNSIFDTFANPETKSNCYYIDLNNWDQWKIEKLKSESCIIQLEEVFSTI